MLNNLRRFWGLYLVIIVILWIILQPKLTEDTENDNQPGNKIKESQEIIPSETNINTTNTNSTSNNTYSNQYDSTWIDPKIKTGKSPRGFAYSPKYDRTIDNYLRVVVGSNTDVVVKLMSYKNNTCIRYIYIKSGDTYSIRNIPQGKYYLKIAYGREWRQRELQGKIIGRFTKNALYEIGEDVLDYNIIYGSQTIEGDVISSSPINSFDTKDISEDEFNK
jgi:hypothetical protein